MQDVCAFVGALVEERDLAQVKCRKVRNKDATQWCFVYVATTSWSPEVFPVVSTLQVRDVVRGVEIDKILNTSLLPLDPAGAGAHNNEETGLKRELFGCAWTGKQFFSTPRACSIQKDRGKRVLMEFNGMGQDDFCFLWQVGLCCGHCDLPSLWTQGGRPWGKVDARRPQRSEKYVARLDKPGAENEVARALGRDLMAPCCQQFNFTESTGSLDDDDLLPALVRNPFFANMLRNEQELLQTWLRFLTPIKASALNCSLPRGGKQRLQNFLQDQVLSSWTRADRKSFGGYAISGLSTSCRNLSGAAIYRRVGFCKAAAILSAAIYIQASPQRKPAV